MIEDIDLATNLNPDEVVNCLNKNNIKHVDVGKKYGTITAIIELEKLKYLKKRKKILKTKFPRHLMSQKILQ